MQKIKEKIFLKFQKRIENSDNKKNILLLFCSFLFSKIISFRHFLYDKKILKVKRIEKFVVSIGNIVCGGVGKTPFTIFLANRLTNIGIVCRNYGSSCKKTFKLQDKNIETIDLKNISDEAFFLFKRTKKPIFVGKNKFLSSKMAEKEKGIKVLLIDDGFQHRKLHRDIDIVILDGKNKDFFLKQKFLPSGFLRDSLKRLFYADFIGINHVEDKDCFLEMEKKIKKYTKAHVFGMAPKFLCIKNRLGKKVDLEKGKIGIFSSISKISYFESFLKGLGYTIVGKEQFFDHSFFDERILERFAKKMKLLKATSIFCTEKDIVKIFNKRFSLPIYYVEIDIKIIFNKDIFENLVSIIKKKVYY